MPPKEFHLSDKELLLAVDGELPVRDGGRVQSHLAACWTCRTRKQEIEATISEFIQVHRRDIDMQIPAADGPRALLKARIAQLTKTQRTSWREWLCTISWRLAATSLAAACGLVALAYFMLQPWAARQGEQAVVVVTPDPNLTPGAIVLASRGEVCSESNTKNKTVPPALRRRVFGEYGIRSAEPSAYEVDYLITPALGGADDIHNLWPQSNRATIWNAQVKDALEDHLRNLVCNGQLDLATAQREMATNWIDAYKKYFHTSQPLPNFP